MPDRVVNQQSFKDGKIVLYQLENRPKRLWLCRIKIPNGKGYVYRGTGTADLYEARKFADEILDEMKIKVKMGQSLTGPRFAKMVEEYETHVRAKGEPTRRELAILAFLNTYAAPYFAKNRITEISPANVARFFDWRRTNSRRKAPRESTIRHETSQFRTFLNWCHRRGLIDRLIALDTPKSDSGRRPHFDSKDWSKLTRFLREWVKDAKGKSGPIHRDRTMLVNYVLILANTGIRVGEARHLRWMDVEAEPSEDATQPNVVLHVTGKTGTREVVASTPEVRTYFERLWALRVEGTSRHPPYK